MPGTIQIIRTNSSHTDFIDLVEKLNSYLAEKNGNKHEFFNQFNQLDDIQHTVVLYYEDQPVACGAFKNYDSTTVEIKRMFVLETHRRKGLSRKILAALHHWAKELNYTHAVLETAKDFKDAVGLYSSSGYEVIPNYGQYAGVEESVCMRIALV